MAMWRRALAAGASLALAIALAGPAVACGSAVVEVYPGPDAMAKTIQQANPGDTLNIGSQAIALTTRTRRTRRHPRDEATTRSPCRP